MEKGGRRKVRVFRKAERGGSGEIAQGFRKVERLYEVSGGWRGVVGERYECFRKVERGGGGEFARGFRMVERAVVGERLHELSVAPG